jgi:hypothetical protein
VNEVRRDDDNELCGHVVGSDGQWLACTVFGGRLGSHQTRAAAEAQVLSDGLASLADRWEYRAGPEDEWQTVCIQEARPGWVRLALDYYSMPGVPTVRRCVAPVEPTPTLLGQRAWQQPRRRDGQTRSIARRHSGAGWRVPSEGVCPSPAWAFAASPTEEGML